MQVACVAEGTAVESDVELAVLKAAQADAFALARGPSGEFAVMLGAYLTISSKLAWKRSASRMMRSLITEVGWLALSGAALGASVFPNCR